MTAKKVIFDKIGALNLHNVSIKSIEPKEDYSIITVYGGDNGSNDWLKYLDQIKAILQEFDESWLINLENDCLDDLWTLRIGIK